MGLGDPVGADITCRYELGGSGVLAAGSVDVADNGVFYQSGGAVETGNLYISGGKYELTGEGQLLTFNTRIEKGYASDPTFVQTGGVHQTKYLSLYNGVYELIGGELIASDEQVTSSDAESGSGIAGPMKFVQRAGTNTVDGSLRISNFEGEASYEMSGGLLNARSVDISVGLFLQTGGQFVAERIEVDGGAYWCPFGESRLELLAGAIEVTHLHVFGDGATFKVGGSSAEMTVHGELLLEDCRFICDSPSDFTMEGYFANYSTMPEMLSDLVNLTMTFVGGAAEHPDGGLVVPSFEVGGIDVGPVLSGFDMNFALGGLNLASGTGKLDLTDGYDNQPGWEGDEALYVIDLNITDGCELNLNGHRLYYLNGSIAPSATVIGGFPEPIPVPGASAEFDGVPTGHSVTAETDIASSAGYGTMGMREGEDNDIRALSWTVHVDEAEVADAIAAASEDYLTLIIGYDAQEIELLGMDETSLRPYRWDEDTAKWILGGTTTDGLAGMSEFIDDLHSDYHDYGLGFCGLNVSEDLLWINVNHASTYGVGGVGVPEPSPLLAWDNQGGDSTWATAANWDPDGVPDATLPARIANGDTVLLNSAGQAAKTVSVENSSALHVTTGGQLTVAEDMAIKSSSKLAIAVSGSACGRADVTGMLQLEPTASLLLNWVPIDPASKFGGDYVVAAYGARTGEFSTIGGGDDLYSIGVAYVAGVDYETDNQITVSLHSLLDGDADLNGKVDFGDYMILEAAFGDTGGWSKGDFDLDGDVDFGDYMILEAAFGDTVPAVAAAAVPEPGTLVMLLGALAGLVVATRRRRAA